jgi:hypothetical protein
MFGCTLVGVTPLIAHKVYTEHATAEEEDSIDTSNVQCAEIEPLISVISDTLACANIDGDECTPSSSLLPSLPLSLAQECYARAKLATAGAAMGMITGMVGVGAGPIIVSFLSIQKDVEMDARQVVGTANLALLPMMASGLVSHALNGNIAWKLAAPLCVGSIAGGAIGGLAAAHAPTVVLQSVLLAFLLASGSSTSLKAARALFRNAK